MALTKNTRVRVKNINNYTPELRELYDYPSPEMDYLPGLVGNITDISEMIQPSGRYRVYFLGPRNLHTNRRVWWLNYRDLEVISEEEFIVAKLSYEIEGD